MYKAIFGDRKNFLLGRVIEQLESTFAQLKQDSESTAPYQFTLPFMAALYHDFLLDQYSGENGELLRPISERLNSSRQTDQGRTAKWRYGEPPYPLAQETPLRAIAFFSWEPESRLFLARRVFPTFFDFLSYSHCPAEWGALGSFLKEFEKNPNNFLSQDLFYEVSQFRQRALPFLEEVDRLKHRAIWALPILDPSTPESLLGVLLFFLAGSEHQPSSAVLPSEMHRFRDYLQRYVSLPMARLLASQQALFSQASRLYTLWREEAARAEDAKRPAHLQTRILEVTLTTSCGSRELQKACATAVGRLSSYALRAVIDETETHFDQKAVLLVAASDPSVDTSHDVLRLIGEAFDLYNHPVTVRFQWLPSPPPNR